MRIRVAAIPRRPGEFGSRRHEPVTFGVPLPRGAVQTGTRWWLSSAVAAEPVQTRVLDQWPDGSARWILIDSRVSAAAGDHNEFFLETQPSAQSAGAPPIGIAEQGDGITVDTGAARFDMRTGVTFPFARIETTHGTAVQTDG